MSRVTAQYPYEYANPGKCKPCCSTVAVQLFMMGLNYCLLRLSHLDCACLSLLASLSAFPSSHLGADPYLHHPALLGLNHLSSLFSLLSLLLTSQIALRTCHFEHFITQPNPLPTASPCASPSLCPHHPCVTILGLAAVFLLLSSLVSLPSILGSNHCIL